MTIDNVHSTHVLEIRDQLLLQIKEINIIILKIVQKIKFWLKLRIKLEIFII